MKSLEIKVKTIDGVEVEFELEYLKRIYLNEIELSFRYPKWMDDGKFEIEKYFLTPESLSKLIKVLENTELRNKFSLASSKSFVESFPTSKKLKEQLEYNNSLPVDYPTGRKQ